MDVVPKSDITFNEFVQLPKVWVAMGGGVSESSLTLWHHVYKWVCMHGYADTADSPEFRDYIFEFRAIAVATVNAHLRRMADAGLLKQNNLKRKLPAEFKEKHISSSVFSFGGGLSSIPTSFVRYTLPGVACPLELKSATAADIKVDTQMRRVFDGIRIGAKLPHLAIESNMTMAASFLQKDPSSPEKMVNFIDLVDKYKAAVVQAATIPAV